MAIWRLITHHDKGKTGVMLTAYQRNSCIALGWGNIGDLNLIRPANPVTIRNAIKSITNYASLRGSLSPGVGGRCLSGFFNDMQLGDLVILGDGEGNFTDVVEVTGRPYHWVTPALDGWDYNHCRSIIWRPNLNGRTLWEQHPREPGWGPRWALIRLL